MELTNIAFIGIAIFLIMMFLKVPIGISMALAGFVGIVLTRGLNAALITLGSVTYRTATSEYLVAIPLFILMGILAAKCGIVKEAFSTFQTWVGQFRGGLAMATMCACCAFGAICGNPLATAATMCVVALPEMRRYQYKDELSLGVICMGGNLGIIVPPSSALIIYGFITQVSIGALFMAGILPGLLTTLMVCITIYLQTRFKPDLATSGPKATWLARIKSVPGLWAILVLLVIVMGGIYVGFFTPTEAGAAGTFAVFLIGMASRKLNLKELANSTREAVLSSITIFLLIIGAMILNTFITTTEVTLLIGNFIAGLEINRYFILAIIIIIYIVLGTFMDSFAVLIVSLPVLFPIVTHLGFDPLLFGVLCMFTIMIGVLTPPVGIVVFVVAAIAKDVPMLTIFRSCTPYLVTMCVCIVLLVAFPQISLVLPNLMLPYR